MKRAVPFLVVAVLFAGCGRDEPAKPQVAAPPPVPPVSQAPAPAAQPEPEPLPSAQPPQPQAGKSRAAKAEREPRTAGAQTYTVRRGDTLQAIAKRHGVNYRDLAKWNNIRDPGRIRAGQQLRLSPPGK